MHDAVVSGVVGLCDSLLGLVLEWVESLAMGLVDV